MTHDEDLHSAMDHHVALAASDVKDAIDALVAACERGDTSANRAAAYTLALEAVRTFGESCALLALSKLEDGAA